MAAKQPPRNPIAPELQAQVLVKSRRRCALCFHLRNDTGEKKGQIAHLDHQRSNNDESNLVFLCLEHHSEFDSTTRQHKDYTVREVEYARESLYEWVTKGMPLIGGGSEESAPSARSQTPEIVVEYEYAENSRDNADADR